MNAIIRFTLCLAAAAPLAQVAAMDPPVASTTGKVLLIDYDRILEGNIERVGDRFRIRHGAGEMTVPAVANMLLLPDKDTAFQLLKNRTKLTDPIALVKLSRWCLANDLKPRALETADMALALLPNDRSLKRFRDDVQTQVSLAPPPPIAPAVEVPKPSEVEPPCADVLPESFGLFATRVQPLLVNACASCHTADRGGSFHLTRPASAFGDKRATQINLAAASGYLNREQPALSPLLVRAVAAHGGGTLAPIRDRQTTAYRYLEDWARHACGPNNAKPPAALPPDVIADATQLPALTPSRPKNSGKDLPLPVVFPATGNDEQTPAMPTIPLKVAESSPPKAKQADTPALPAKKDPTSTEPADPFDPEQFNQQNKSPMK
jgi:hypothetical protein